MLTEKSFDTGEIVINFAESDTIGPPLVLLHGATLNWQTFGDFIPALEQRWRLYACDLRGHGGSGRAGVQTRSIIPLWPGSCSGIDSRQLHCEWNDDQTPAGPRFRQ